MTYEDIHIKLRAKGYKFWYTDYFPNNPNFSGFVVYSRFAIDAETKLHVHAQGFTSTLVLETAEYLYDFKNKNWIKERIPVKDLAEPTAIERLIYA